VGLAAATAVVRRIYFQDLRAVTPGSQKTQLFTVQKGASADSIGKQLKDAGLIHSAWAFKLYVTGSAARDSLQAGTYSLSPSQSMAQIVSQLTHGKVATDLVTIIPGQRLDQVRTMLINYGFSKNQVEAALDPTTYKDNPALVDKPASASLEGYLYPDSYQKDATTLPSEIITESLAEMGKQLTPDIRAAFAQKGLSTYQGIVVASIIEQEVSKQSDRATAAQVFLKRLQNGIPLGSDVTAYYGAFIAGKGHTLQYDSPYNTRLHTGLPPGPIGSVSARSLQAVAHPSQTDYLYFVTGDDGVTHFSNTLDEHNAATAQYCHKLCSE